MIQIIINNLYKSYGKKSVFNNVNLRLNSENIYFLITENGSGKTTFFKCLLSETNYKGSIIDKNLLYAYLPEKVITPEFVTVIDYLKMYLNLEYKEVDENLINEYLEKFEILEHKNSYINKLSKGSKQKVFIIKMLLSNADVYLFDEPLSGLDVKSRKIFIKLLKELHFRNKLIIIATHYFDEYKIKCKKVIDLNEFN